MSNTISMMSIRGLAGALMLLPLAAMAGNMDPALVKRDLDGLNLKVKVKSGISVAGEGAMMNAGAALVKVSNNGQVSVRCNLSDSDTEKAIDATAVIKPGRSATLETWDAVDAKNPASLACRAI